MMRHSSAYRNQIQLLAVTLSLGLLSAETRGEPGGATVEVRGIRIVGPGYSENALRPFNWTEGTTVALLITFPQGGLIDFDDDASTIEIFTDDRKKNLLDGKKSRFSFNEGYDSGHISEDAKACLVEVQSPTQPSKGTRAIQIKGILVLKSATGKKTYQQKGVKVQEGAKIQAGPIPFTISKIGKPEWSMEDEKFSVTLKATQDLSTVDSIRFLDAKGKEIKTSHGGTTSMSAFGSITVEKAFNFKEKVSAFTVEVTYWMGVKEIKLPYAVQAGVGM